jgi:uncharacterized protein
LNGTLSQETLNEIVRRLADALAPERIVVFGSHAWGEPTADSDLDLLAVVAESEESPHKRAVRAHRALRGLAIPCDILVRTRAEMERVNSVRSSLLYRAMTEGRRIDGGRGNAGGASSAARPTGTPTSDRRSLRDGCERRARWFFKLVQRTAGRLRIGFAARAHGGTNAAAGVGMWSGGPYASWPPRD